MYNLIRCALLATIGTAILAGPIHAQDTPQPEDQPAMARRALEVLRGMSDYLKAHEQFTFEGDVEEEDVLASGQKLKRHKRIRTYVRRPGRARGDQLSAEKGFRHYSYDGKTFTSFDAKASTYARVEVPPTIDEAIEFMFEKYDHLPPLADLIEKDPYESMTQEIETAAYLGRDLIRDVLCHHLAFTQELIDWQVWIEDGPTPLLRKLVIDYKRERGEPQYSVSFDEWNMNAELPDFVFAFTPPRGARRIQYMPAGQPWEQPGDPSDKTAADEETQ